jgi:hypothetical protein
VCPHYPPQWSRCHSLVGRSRSCQQDPSSPNSVVLMFRVGLFDSQGGHLVIFERCTRACRQAVSGSWRCSKFYNKVVA